MVNYCPHCQTRYSADPQSGDFVHECNSGNLALDEESVVVIGDWVDFTGSADNTNQALTAGTQNDLFATRAQIESNASTSTRDSRGKRIALFRSRQHLQYIPSKGGDF